MITVPEIELLMEKYHGWLKDRTLLRQINSDFVEVSTPHLDRHNDCIQIYVRREGAGLLLTDDGYTLNDLINSGCPLDSPKRQELLRVTLAGFGVHLDGDQLCVRATQDNFPLKKHNLVQSMLAVNDLFYLASPYVASLFVEDVTMWLDMADVRFTPRVKFAGKSGYDHMFDFVIPRSRRQPERLVQAINNPKKDAAETLMFKWLDTREVRTPDARLYALLNDSNCEVSATVIEAFKNYDILPTPWSKRDQLREELTA